MRKSETASDHNELLLLLFSGMNEFLVSFLVGKTFSLEMLIKEKSVINVRKPPA